MKLLKGMRLIDGTGCEPIEDAALQIENGKIVSVGKFSESDITPETEVIDLAGKTIMPGLIDAHVHLCFEAVADPIGTTAKDSDITTTIKAMTHAQATLRGGVTTVRDMGGKNYIDLELKKNIAEGKISGPRMIVSGRLLTMTGGHGWPLGYEADGVDELRKGARAQLKAGVDVVKIMATGGVMTPGVEPGSPQLTVEEMRAAIEEANKAGRKTATHAQGTTGIKNAIRAGINSIEHGCYLDDEAINMMLDKNVYLVPTLAAPYWIIEKGLAAGIPEYAVAKTEKVIKDHFNSFKLAYKKGVKIAMGTDAGTPFNEHGKNYHEIKLMVEKGGMDNMDAIVAATKSGADLLGIADTVGTLEPGKQADFLVLDRNPLEDINALDNLESVYKGGQIVE